MVANRLRGSGARLAGQLLLSLAIALLAIVAAVSVAEPRWESNDDVAMAMVAGGYGLAALPSPAIFFSNVLWGRVIQLVDHFAGASGYAVATYAALAIAATAVVWQVRTMFQGRLGWLLTAGLLVLLFLRPAVLPQFTINAGLLAVGAWLCLSRGTRGGRWSPLVAAVVLGLMGFLVRMHEALLVALVALPLLDWPRLVRDRRAIVSLLALCTCAAGALLADRHEYSRPEWDAFRTLNPVRAAFTDYERARQIHEHPQVLARHGLSHNDLDLVATWFFVDPQLAEPSRLQAILDETPAGPAARSQDLENAWRGLEAFLHPQLIWGFGVAILLALLFPCWRIGLSWAILLAAIATIGYLGRPAVLRVYVPLVALMVLAPLVLAAANGSARWMRSRLWIAAAMVAIAAGGHAADMLPEARASAAQAREIRKEMRDFPAETVVIWGHVLPFEMIDAPWSPADGRARWRLYGLGVFTLAPFSVPYADVERKVDLVTRLRTQEGVLMLANPLNVEGLSVYCREHFAKPLRTVAVRTFSFGTLQRLSCV